MNSNSKIKSLTCCCCGELTQGKQWWNRDIGFGLCHKCADCIEAKEGEDYMEICYGHKGVHYYLTLTEQK